MFVSMSNTERPVGLEFAFCICDGMRCLCGLWIRNVGGIGSGSLMVVCLIELLAKKSYVDKNKKTHWWITLLCLSGLAGEHNKPHLSRLSYSESTTLANFVDVVDCLSTNSWVEEWERTNAKSGGFCLASVTSAKFSSRLVKPDCDHCVHGVANPCGNG